MDTRPGPRPELGARLKREIEGFFSSLAAPTTFITGNHDPDLSKSHFADLAQGRVFATHGDILFRSIVPWGRDAAMVTRQIGEELAKLPAGRAEVFEDRIEAYRRVAARVSQRHQAEPNPAKYLLRILFDTSWPPWRIANLFAAWRVSPGRAADLARRHRPGARFILVGHTHRPGVWRFPDGIVAINTGSFCPPLGALTVDLWGDRLIVRRVLRKRGAFLPGGPVAEFPL
jgi:predicted phosphodiesterase